MRRTVRDRVGNESAETAERFQVDTDRPSLELTCPRRSSCSATPTTRGVRRELRAGARTRAGPTRSTPTVGRKTLTRTATDNVGHRTTESCTVLVVYPTPGTPALSEGDSPNDGDFGLAWTASAPAGHPLRYVLQRRDAGEDATRETVGDDLGNLRARSPRASARTRARGSTALRGVNSRTTSTPSSRSPSRSRWTRPRPRAPRLTADRDPEYAGDGGWYADTVDVTTS